MIDLGLQPVIYQVAGPHAFGDVFFGPVGRAQPRGVVVDGVFGVEERELVGDGPGNGTA